MAKYPATETLSEVDEYGFTRTAEENAFKSTYLSRLTHRSRRWAQVFRDDQIEAGRILQRFIRKGVPFNMRKAIWMRTSGSERNLDQNPNLYKDLWTSERLPADVSEIIKIDLPRTFPENIYFEAHKVELYNILSAFAQSNSSVGYCQGLNYIAGLILLVTKDEVATFWLLKFLVEEAAFEYHTRTMKGLQRDIFVISELVKQKRPLINEKVLELGIPWAVILTKWLVCLFSEVLPVETVLRIWDVMFAEGHKIIFRAALAIILILEEDIMKANDITELADLFRNVSKDSRMLDCHSFMEFMFKIKLKRREIDLIRKQFKAL